MTTERIIDALVIGEALIDIVEARGSVVEHVGGSPANVALGLGRLGDEVVLLTQLGADARAAAVVDHLSASSVEVAAAATGAHATSTALARIDADGQATYEFQVAWDRFEAPPGLRPRLAHAGSIACFLQPGADSVRAVLRECEADEVTFDPNIRPALVGSRDDAFPAYEQTARLATVVKMSDQDAEWLYPGLSADDVVDEVLALGARLVAITLGAEGAVVASPSDRVRLAAVSVVAVDTIGAGDTFMASLAHSVLHEGSVGLKAAALRAIGERAVRSAAITVSRAGADLPWASEV